MKKFTLFAAAAFVAMAANAQYTCEPGAENVLKQKPSTVDYVILSEEAIASFTNAGATMQYVGPSEEEGRFLYYWSGIAPGSEAYPRVDFDNGGYTSVEVAPTEGWSGAGFFISCPQEEPPLGPGVNISHFTDETVFHMAYMSPTDNAPASIGCILLDGAKFGSKPAKFALGDPYNDNGVVYPAIGPKAGNDWQGIEISLGDLKKLWPDYDLNNTEAWGGNIFAFLGGAVAGQTFAFDAMYFYNSDGSGIESISADNEAAFVVTGKTVNVANASGIVLYNLSGVAVKHTAGTTLGLDNLTAGVYVAQAAGKTCKIVVK